MISNKPYLVRALYEWISDNGWTPYVLVKATVPGCRVPPDHVKNGRIILNIASDVVSKLVLGNEALEFTARFSGMPIDIYIPITAVAAIYAKENGEGMVFPEEPPEDPADGAGTPPIKGKPNLKIVK